jgi:hypothetical protein
MTARIHHRHRQPNTLGSGQPGRPGADAQRLIQRQGPLGAVLQSAAAVA